MTGRQSYSLRYPGTPEHDFDGDRFDAVMFVACTMVRAECSDEEVVGVLMNKENGIYDHIRDARHNDQARLAYAWRQAHRARERTELDFELADKGGIKSNQQNIRVALAKLGV